jgi:hypothetical protein
MMASIDNMQAIARICSSRQPLPEDLSAWLAASFQSFLDQRSATLNEAFGVRNARGGVSWRMEASMRARDGALRRLGAEHFAGLTKSAQAARIHQLALRYAASNWRFDYERQAMPRAYAGTPHEWLWRAFKSGACMPLGMRQLRTILGP